MKSKSLKTVVLEKNHAYRDYLRTIISDKGGVSFCFKTGTTCLDNLEVLDPDLMVIGALDHDSVIRFLNALQAVRRVLRVIVINDNPVVKEYVAINRFDQISLLDGFDKFPEAINNFHPVRKHAPDRSLAKISPFIIGNSPAMRKIKSALPDLSLSSESVLIKGEKGVGKELLARWIHLNSANRTGLFVKINAALLSNEKTEWHLIEFLKENTAAKNESADKNENTAKGTIYFDELSDISDDIRSELLLIMEDGSPFSAPDGFNFRNGYRILAGTNQNIESLVHENRFRKDLFYRMNVFNLTIPPLRHRKGDIPMLTDFLTYKYCRDFNKSYFGLSKDVKNIFCSYDWPGNIDELEHAVKQAVLIRNEKKFLSGFYVMDKKAVNGSQKSVQHLPTLDEMLKPNDYLKKIDKMSLKDICWDCLAQVETSLLKKALDNTNWNRKKAADMLNISYKSMLNKIKEYGLA